MGLVIEPDENKEFIVHVRGDESIAHFTHVIEPVTHTPVLDHTGLTGEYSFDLKFAVIEPFSGPLAAWSVQRVRRFSPSFNNKDCDCSAWRLAWMRG